MIRHRALACATVLGLGTLLVLPGCKSKKKTVAFSPENMVASENDAAEFVHPNYRFSIKGLDNRWKLLPPGEIESIVPDAAAGAMRVGSIHGAVIVEPLGDVDPADYLGLLVENMRTTQADLVVGDFEKITHKGHDAMSVELDAVASGIPFHYKIVALIHQGHGYQFLAWHPVGAGATSSQLEEFFEAVALEEGSVTPPPNAATEDFNGVGRRVAKGRFESPFYRLAATASEGWAIMNEAELALTNPDAELGMKHVGSGAYLIVIAERLTGQGFEQYRESYFTDTEAAHAAMV